MRRGGRRPGPSRSPAGAAYRLPADALVVRGGLMRYTSDLRKSAETALEVTGRMGLSVYAGDDVTLEDLVTAARMPYGQVRRTTAGRLRERGFRLEQTGRPRHYTVLLPDANETTLRRFIDAFDIPEPNPLKGPAPSAR